jgi:hypothetical protein
MNPDSALGPQGLQGLEALGAVECSGYRLTLTPWWCIENQLSDYCLPGFPCETCEAGVTIRTTGWKPVPLKKPKPQPKRRPAWWKNASKAVQRDWLREREGR